MVICSQHGTTRTFGQSTLTVGPWRLRTAQKWQLGSSDPKMEVVSDTRLALNTYRWEKPLKKEKPQVLSHKENLKTTSKASPVLKTGRISKAFRVVSGFGQGPNDSIHQVTHVC